MRIPPPLLVLLGAGAWLWWRDVQAAAGYGAGEGDGSIFLPAVITGVDVNTPETVQPSPASAPRGIRNNNPGNIRRTTDTWQGQAAQQSDPSYVQFTEPVYGLRALCKILLKYQRSYGARSIQAIINRWAPPTENNTAAYVSAVAAQLGVSATAFIDLSSNLQNLAALARAIVTHENGAEYADYYAAGLYSQAAQLAVTA